MYHKGSVNFRQCLIQSPVVREKILHQYRYPNLKANLSFKILIVNLNKKKHMGHVSQRFNHTETPINNKSFCRRRWGGLRPSCGGTGPTNAVSPSHGDLENAGFTTWRYRLKRVEGGRERRKWRYANLAGVGKDVVKKCLKNHILFLKMDVTRALSIIIFVIRCL